MWSTQIFATGVFASALNISNWPVGTYPINVVALDDAGKFTFSKTVNYTVRSPISITTTATPGIGTSKTITASVSGTNSLSGSILKLQTSPNVDGPWIPTYVFSGENTTLQMNVDLPLGVWIKASINGSATLSDAESAPLQLLDKPELTCTFPKSGKVNSSVKGNCKFLKIDGSVPIILKTSTGSIWNTISNSSANNASFPIVFTSRMLGKLKLQIESPGVPNRYTPFKSNISVISILK
jgi:hypothetical protein